MGQESRDRERMVFKESKREGGTEEKEGDL